MKHPAASLVASVARRALSCIAVAALVVFHEAIATAQAAAPLRSFSVEPSCRGACSDPMLIQVDPGRVVALWSGEDDMWWAQSIEATKLTPVGRPEKLGKLSVGRDAAARGLSMAPLADGDLALFGTLADGRITYARGSASEGRRVPARAITEPTVSKVLSVAATPYGPGTALLVLSDLEGMSRNGAQMEVSLSRLDGKGQLLGAALRWRAPKGADARVLACGDQLYAAWSDPKRVVVRVISAASALGNELFYASPQRLRGLSPLFCEGQESRLLASYYRPGISIEVTPELYVAKIASSAKGKQVWKKVKVAGKPHPVFGVAGAIAAHKARQGLAVTIGSDGRAQTVALDAKHTALTSTRIEHAAAANCILLDDGKRVLCARDDDEPRAKGCWRATALTFTVYGDETEGSSKSAKAATYFSAPQIEAPDRPSKAQQEADAARLSCTDPAFDPLRKALDRWCEAETQKPPKERYQYYDAFCRPGSNALQDQLHACSDHPACPESRDARVPSVERAEHAKGTRVELKADNCSVWFSRQTDGSYRVSDRECVGDL